MEFRLSKREVVHAVSGVSFNIYSGETLGLVGESGCGKSTTARAVMQLPVPTSGKVILNGKDLTALSGEELRRERRHFQIIFQDPISSLNPRRKVSDIVEMPLVVMKMGSAEERAARIREVLEAVGLDPDTALDRRPFQFSGGQCQRISIARALIGDPRILILDEATASVDTHTEYEIQEALERLVAGRTTFAIAHRLSTLKNADRLLVLDRGRVAEVGTHEELLGLEDGVYRNLVDMQTEMAKVRAIL